MSEELKMLEENGDHPADRFQRSIEEIVEEDMVSIKIHILVEEALDLLLASLSYHPQQLPSLQFPQKLGLAQALNEIRHDAPYWGLIRSLNSLRNAVAHPKDHAKKAQKMLDLERMFLSSHPHHKKTFADLSQKHRLYFIGASITGFLAASAFNAKTKLEYISNDQGLRDHLRTNGSTAQF